MRHRSDYAQRISSTHRQEDFPKWRMSIQIMPEKKRRLFIILRPHQGLAAKDYPLIEIGELVLDRNSGNYLPNGAAAFDPKKSCRAWIFARQDAAGTPDLLS